MKKQPELTIISLGWGVQSWTLAAMSALGELPKVDFAIHSDTTWEYQDTYEFAEQWTSWLEQNGVKVITTSDAKQARKVHTAKTDIPACTSGNVGGGAPGAVADKANGKVFIPAFSRYEPESVVDEWDGVSGNAYTVGDNINGQLRRQSTQRWKIAPMRRYISQELKRRGLHKMPGVVTQWLGITIDEWQRAKDSDVKYITHSYPLLDKRMSRADCIDWLRARGLSVPPKSSCTFCPYHSKAMWQELKRANGTDWAQAKSVDKAIRNKRPPYPLFVHSARVPLEQAVTIPEDFGASQSELFDFDDKDSECDSGYCFL